MDLNILDLPDDCLISIFNRFAVRDLLSVHKTCKRFSYVAQRCFSLSHREVEIAFRENYNGETDYGFTLSTGYGCDLFDNTDFNNLHTIFKFFGKSMSRLFIRQKLDSEEAVPEIRFVLRWADEYCGENLTEL